MKFLDLYRDNKRAVRETLTAMWCSDTRNDKDGSYSEQLRELIDNELFTSKRFIPLVQCMDRYEPVKSVSPKEAESLVGDLWEKTLPPKKYYPPYEHQYLAWKALTNIGPEKRSMVVTTGTGSGKTECFMLPLVNDLIGGGKKDQIQAIFLYPLNALMEDQKERLQALLNGTDIKFAVYNGNLPEKEGSPNSKDSGQRTLFKRVAEERRRYPNIVATRDEMHQLPPNIILTNPTMLEYMLLRQKDQSLFTKGSLRWIVIDETHTFSGAGAAELAMLIRRVLKAFGQEPKEVRFATSSATIGNAKNQKEQEENNAKLVQFISDITGVPTTQIDFIPGKRKVENTSETSPEVIRCRSILDINDYVMLTDLFPDKNESIERKLERLDQLCGLEKEALKAKVHFFYRVPNNGLKIQLDDHKNGVFRIKAQDSTDSNQTPFLELLRCEHCGGYIAIGESVKGSGYEYRPLTRSGGDMFAFDEDAENVRRMIFGLTKNEISSDDKNGDVPVRIEGKYCYFDSQTKDKDGWRIIHNVQNCCPHCHVQILGKKRDNENESENDSNADLSKNVSSFRIPASFLSRVLAPSILPHLHIKEKDDDGVRNPHKGQQYISFVDSRQAAAQSTLRQNIEEERLWVYSRILNLLTKKKTQGQGNQEKLDKLLQQRQQLVNMDDMEDSITAIDEKIKKLKSSSASSMSWMDIFRALSDEPESDWLAYQFANKSENSNELDSDADKVDGETKAKYLQSIMIELLGRRPRMASAPETMGLFTTTYPKLDQITELPKAIQDFNVLINADKKKIDLTEWKNLLKIFLDFVVRSNQSIYIKTGDDSCLDIFACQRFDTAKAARRPVRFRQISSDNTSKGGSHSAVALLLAALLVTNKNDSLADVIDKKRDDINKVIEELRNTLIDKTKILQLSERYQKEKEKWELDDYKDEDGNPIPSYRLNVVDISFKTIDQVWLCDARKSLKDSPVLRPVDTLFMGMSPHTIGNSVSKPVSECNKWDAYPYVDGLINGQPVSHNDIIEWAKQKRSLLWTNGLWGENGEFTNRLNVIYSYPEIFVQAEHTAQVDKIVSKHSQELFKNQKINILACSTTMEMGVDLGNLELVLMTSIPPHPSNYKQRAGRSGRNDDTRSACITLCNSDSIGLRTLENPMQQLIKRQMAVPFVDLQSPQVIQRHVNAFLFRASGVFFIGNVEGKNNLGQEVIDFFTPYFFDHDEKINHYTIRNIQDENEIYPSDGLGDVRSTRYFRFLNYLNGNVEDGNPSLADSKPSLTTLLKGTCYENETDGCIMRCKYNIEKVYDSLAGRVEDIREAYNIEKERVLAKPSSGTVVGNRVDSGYGYVLRHKFSECLAQNMITFLATNRFTPNANMPVEVIEFNVNLRNESKKNFGFKASNNPSYALQEAIFQYAPGNTIVLENRTNVIRGLLYTGQYKQTRTFKRLYSDGNDTVIDFPARLKGSKKKWPVSNKEELVLVEPVSYIPDINADYTRIVDKNSYTQVSAQLIGAGPWQGESRSLIAMRSNRDCCDAKILYYNEGTGYGYCFCPDCGKTVLESSNYGSKFKYPEEMNDQSSKKDGQEYQFHYRIDRKDYKNSKRGKRIRCIQKKIMRNVILGGLIQTDYCEIKVREGFDDFWMMRDIDNDKVLITLGIVITKTFTEYIGKDRKDVGFAIMPNGHLCIFDTNPGGSGYSNQLSGQRTMMDVLGLSLNMLKEASSKEMLLDKYTKQYLDKLDIERTSMLINDILKSFDVVPESVKNIYPNASVGVAVVEDIFKSFRDNYNANEDMVLFVNDDWNQWIYQPDPNSTEDYSGGLKQRLQPVRHLNLNNVRLCVFGDSPIRYPIYNMLGQLSEWTQISQASVGSCPVFPVAIAGGRFYFTNHKEVTNANYEWGQSDLYSVPVAFAPKFDFKQIDISYRPQFSKKFVLSLESNKAIKSKLLGGIIEGYIKDIIDEFLSYCRNNRGEMKVVYLDEHLKSPLSFIVILQFIEHFMRKINMPFSLEFVNEEYDETIWSHTIASNYENDIDRNDKLRDMTNEWMDIVNGDGLVCTSVKISTKARRALPHWRSLQFRIQDKELVIYPNGGIINEWLLDKRDRNNFILTEDSLTVEDNISLFRNKEIMYDAEIREL